MPKPLNVNWGEIRALASSGMTFPEISKKTGISLGAIKTRSRREHWNIEKFFGGKNLACRSPALARQQQAKASQRTAHAAFSLFLERNSSSKAAIAAAVEKLAKFLETLPAEELAERCQQLESVTKSGSRVFNWDDPRQSFSPSFNHDLLALSPDQLAALARAERDQLAFQNAHPANAQLIPPDPAETN